MTNPYPYPPPYPYAMAPGPRLPAHPSATPSLVLGIVGITGILFALPLILCPLAWYYGAVSLREAEREPNRWRTGGEGRAGMILGIIGTALLGLFMLLVLIAASLSLIALQYDSGYAAAAS